MSSIQIDEISKADFEKRYVVGNRRRYLYGILEEALTTLDKHCYAYQVWIFGSYVNATGTLDGLINAKQKPGDLDIILRGYVTPAQADLLPESKGNGHPKFKFNDPGDFIDFTPVNAIVGNVPAYQTGQQVFDAMNRSTPFGGKTVNFAVLVKELQKIPE